MNRRIDPVVIIIPILLCGAGLLIIYGNGSAPFFRQQLIWLGISLLVFLSFLLISPRILYAWAYPFYLLTIISLILVLFVADKSPKRWLHLGWFNFQPSELMKFGYILVLSKYLSLQKEIRLRFKSLIIPILLTLIPMGLILAEPNLGTAIIFLPIFAGLLYLKGLRPLHLFILFSPLFSIVAALSLPSWILYMVVLSLLLFLKSSIGSTLSTIGLNSITGLLTPVTWSMLHGYQRERVLGFFSPWIDPKGVSWQVIQSKIALGSGRFFGKGLFSATQAKLEFLPNAHTDFIFATLGEEFGFIGCLSVIALFLIFLSKMISKTIHTREEFSSLYIWGFVILISWEVFFNIAMTLGIMPVAGIPLPFMSYGGSSLLVNFAMLGFALNLLRYRY